MHDKALYLTRKGWVYTPDKPYNLRWVCPGDRKVSGLYSAYTKQRAMENGTLRVFQCANCGRGIVDRRVSQLPGLCPSCKRSAGAKRRILKDPSTHRNLPISDAVYAVLTEQARYLEVHIAVLIDDILKEEALDDHIGRYVRRAKGRSGRETRLYRQGG